MTPWPNVIVEGTGTSSWVLVTVAGLGLSAPSLIEPVEAHLKFNFRFSQVLEITINPPPRLVWPPSGASNGYRADVRIWPYFVPGDTKVF
jgi:hypothetical protein